jgi:hypothetical protein
MNDEIRKELEAVLSPSGNFIGSPECAELFIDRYGPAILKLLEQPAQVPVAWMLETTYAPRPLWLTGAVGELSGKVDDITNSPVTCDPNKAMRFPTKAAAEAVLAAMIAQRKHFNLFKNGYIATEHAWSITAPLPVAAAQPTEKSDE